MEDDANGGFGNIQNVDLFQNGEHENIIEQHWLGNKL